MVEFFKNVTEYFIAVMDYLKSHLPLADPLLQHAEVVDVTAQADALVQSLRFFLLRFPCLLPSGCDINMVLEQFGLYQVMDVTSCIGDSIDKTWNSIGKLEDGQFRELSLVMRGILTVPHGSAHCERVFSSVRKNVTEIQSGRINDGKSAGSEVHTVLPCRISAEAF